VKGESLLEARMVSPVKKTKSVSRGKKSGPAPAAVPDTGREIDDSRQRIYVTQERRNHGIINWNDEEYRMMEKNKNQTTLIEIESVVKGVTGKEERGDPRAELSTKGKKNAAKEVPKQIHCVWSG